jgi:hypothetical protein
VGQDAARTRRAPEDRDDLATLAKLLRAHVEVEAKLVIDLAFDLLDASTREAHVSANALKPGHGSLPALS